MKTPAQLFTEHPASVGENYVEHMGSALSFAGPLFIASLCALMHAALPFAFEKTASGIVTKLYGRMVTNRSKLPKAPEQAPETAA